MSWAQEHWAWAVVALIFFSYLAVDGYFEDKRETQVPVECIRAGGEVGSKMGNPTCDMP